MTAALFLTAVIDPPLQSAFLPDEIGHQKGQIQNGEENPSQQVELQQVKRAGIGQETQKRKRLGFMKEKPVIDAGQLVDGEDGDEIKFSPGEGAQEGGGRWPIFMDQHHEDDANDDAGM
jgi:hypothetical protein